MSRTARMAGLARRFQSRIGLPAKYRSPPGQTREAVTAFGPNCRENNDFGVLDLTLARIVNGADCWPPPRVPGGHGGAIAQRGERVVRNGEGGGSTPPGSTSLRSLRELRLGKPSKPIVAKRAKA